MMERLGHTSLKVPTERRDLSYFHAPLHNLVWRHSRIAVQAIRTCILVPVRFLCAVVLP